MNMSNLYVRSESIYTNKFFLNIRKWREGIFKKKEETDEFLFFSCIVQHLHMYPGWAINKNKKQVERRLGR